MVGEVGLARVGWRDGEKMQTIVTELKKKKTALCSGNPVSVCTPRVVSNRA